MSNKKESKHIRYLKSLFSEGKINRREFLHSSTMLGLSATAAYAFAGKVSGTGVMPTARAADMPTGGQARIGLRVLDLSSPHTYSWFESEITRQVCPALTRTAQDNVTRPFLLERWEVSDDLRSWTLNLRDIKWHNGRQFTADDVVWNLNRMLDPKTGSSQLSLMSYMVEEYDTGEVDGEGKKVMSTRLWDANALEKVDDKTVRLNTKTVNVSVPQHLFNWPAHIIDPEEDGKFGPGSNGTGPFELVSYSVGEDALLKGRKDYWGTGPYLDEVRFVDFGDDPNAPLGALASRQVHGLYEVDIAQLPTVGKLDHLKVYSVANANTVVARMKVNQKPFDDPRVRKAMRLAIDPQKVRQLVFQEYGLPAEHHHVCPVQPDYAEMPPWVQDADAAKALLAEAGYPDGIDISIACKTDPAFELSTVQIMKQQWAPAGIRVKINPMPSAQYWEIWQTVPFGFTSWAHRPVAVMLLEQAYRSGVAWNESEYANPEFDRLLDEAGTIADPAQRRTVMAKIQKIMQEDGPIVQPVWRPSMTAYDKTIKGFSMHPARSIFVEEIALES